jgi:predicted nucleic acid-binding Zn ribbon protein
MVPRCCSVCGVAFPLDANVRRTTCGDACRQARSRARRSLREQVALDLLLRQTRAVQAGNKAALSAITAEAERLLGAP